MSALTDPELVLIFDTNVIIYEKKKTEEDDQPAQLECMSLLEEMARHGKCGKLKNPILIIIPKAVLQEIQILGNSNSNNSRGKAKSALDRLADLLTDWYTNPIENIQIVLQTDSSEDRLQKEYYPMRINKLNEHRDGLILVYCLDLQRRFPDADVWLVTEDKQLQARALLSGLHAVKFYTLKAAMELDPYDVNEQRNRNDYHNEASLLDKLPSGDQDSDRKRRSRMFKNWLARNRLSTLSDVTAGPKPTLTHAAEKKVFDIKDMLGFRNKLFELVPAFKQISLRQIAIVGGFVVDVLLGREPKDINLFFVLEKPKGELKPTEIHELLADRVRTFVAELMQSTDPGGISVTRCREVYTILAPESCLPYPVQFAFCANLPARFNATDITCTEIAYYCDEIITSARGLDGLRNSHFVIKHQHYDSLIKMQRIVRYFEKGFDVVLEGLDMKEVNKINKEPGDTHFILPLPYLIIKFEGTQENKIFVNSMEPSSWATCQHTSLDILLSRNNVNANWDQHNIRCLTDNRFGDFIFSGRGRDVLKSEAFALQLGLRPATVCNFYAEVKVQMSHESEGSIQFDRALMQFFNCRDLREYEKGDRFIHIDKNDAEKYRNVLSQAIDSQIATINTRLEKYNTVLNNLDGPAANTLLHRYSADRDLCSESQWYDRWGDNSRYEPKTLMSLNLSLQEEFVLSFFPPPSFFPLVWKNKADATIPAQGNGSE